MNWQLYYKNTKFKPPSATLLKAFRYVKKIGKALDLGSGGMHDTQALLEIGFKVVAVDKEPTPIMNQASFFQSSFESFDFPPKQFDLINAQYSLFFLKPKDFPIVWRKIKTSLKKDGIFVGNFIGPRDEWAWTRTMTVLSESDVRNLFSDMEILSFTETAQPRHLASGQNKFWHTFDIIARKK